MIRSVSHSQHSPTLWQGDASHPSATTHLLQHSLLSSLDPSNPSDQMPHTNPSRDAFYILLPLLIVLSTFLFLLLLFLICVILLRRRRGIMLRDHDGPVDMSREDLVEGEGGFEGVESRWLESVVDSLRRSYLRAKGPSASFLFLNNLHYLSYMHSSQSGSFSTLQTLSRLTSLCLSSYQFRKRVSQLGALNLISKQ